jgi:hypothetical protein
MAGSKCEGARVGVDNIRGGAFRRQERPDPIAVEYMSAAEGRGDAGGQCRVPIGGLANELFAVDLLSVRCVMPERTPRAHEGDCED